MASNHPGCLFFIEATHASTAFRLYMHSLDGLGLPSGDTWTYSRPTIQHSFLARRMVPCLRPVTAIRTLSQTHSLGANWITLFMPTSHYIQATTVAPHIKHSLHYFPAVKPLDITRKVIATAVPLAHPYFKCLIHGHPTSTSRQSRYIQRKVQLLSASPSFCPRFVK